MQQKIVLVGGPGTGKSSVIKELAHQGYFCMNEISREVTSKAQEEGIDQLFLEKPLLFSELLLQGRLDQYSKAEETSESLVFFDRGIPDVEAYLLYAKTDFPKIFSDYSRKHRYDFVFYFHPWQEIYQPDKERYETYGQSTEINDYLIHTYQKYGYTLIDMPFCSVKKRVDFILDMLI